MFVEPLQRGQQEGEIIREQKATALAEYLRSNMASLKTLVKGGADNNHIWRIVEITLITLLKQSS